MGRFGAPREARLPEPCERCGAAASFFACTARGDVQEDGHTATQGVESHSYCVACAKAAGLYPGKLGMLWVGIQYFLLWPVRLYMRLKYPPEYWKQRFKEVEKNSQ